MFPSSEAALASAFRKVLMREETYVEVWDARRGGHGESYVIVDGGGPLTDDEAEAVAAVHEEKRRARG